MSSTFQETTKLLFGVDTTRERLRFWGIRSGLSILDQGLTSGAGFILNLLLARWLTSEAYGAFAVAFATLLFLSGFHNVLLLEPMCVIGPASYSERMVEYFLAQLRVQAVLSVILSALLFVTAAVLSRLGTDRELVMAVAASAFAVPLILLLWLVRRMCYIVHRPAIAVWASAGYLALIVGGLFLLRAVGRMGPATAMMMMALASLAATLAPIRLLGIMPSHIRVKYPWKQVLRENWKYGRWLVASTTLFSVASQAQTYLAAALLGLGAAGVFRAMQIPSLVMTQITTAISLFVLPVMASQYGLGRISRLRSNAAFVSVVLTAMAGTYAAVLGIFAKPIERVLYGGKFAGNAWLIPVLGLVPVCIGFATGFSMALRASQQPYFDLLANAVSAPVGLVTAVVFMKLWGLGGAGISLVVGFAVYAGVFFWSFLRWIKRTDAIRGVAIG